MLTIHRRLFPLARLLYPSQWSDLRTLSLGDGRDDGEGDLAAKAEDGDEGGHQRLEPFCGAWFLFGCWGWGWGWGWLCPLSKLWGNLSLQFLDQEIDQRTGLLCVSRRV